MFAQTRFSIGMGFGGHGTGLYQPPSSYASNIPPCPGPDYTRKTTDAIHGLPDYWNRQPFSNGYQVAPRFDNRFDDDERRGFARGFEQDRFRSLERGRNFDYEQDRNRRFDQGRNFSGQDHNHTQGFIQDQARDFGQNQNQNQNRGNRDRSNCQDNRQGNGYANGSRRR